MVSLVIPTYNAASYLHELIKSLSTQTLAHELVIIDSQSKDSTQEILREYNINFISIPSTSFNHGSTRNLGVELTSSSNVIFFTQDAIPASSQTLELLINSLDSSPDVAMAYGRQLPYPDADTLSRFARLTNYPPVSVMKSLKNIPEMGIRTCHCSNSFAAYKKDALLSVGGFPSDNILGEDVSVAARLILKGKTIAYCAESTVYHSHNYTLQEEFKRYFDIGVFHQQQKDVLKPFTQAEAEGVKYVLAEWAYLKESNQLSNIPVQLVRTLAKYAGYRAGQWHDSIPVSLKRMMSMHEAFWN